MAREQLELWSGSPAALSGNLPRVRLSLVDAESEVDVLRALDARMQHLVDNARCERTRTAYASDWHAFEHWCHAHELVALPTSPNTLARYLTHLADRGRKMSTIRRARIAIGVMHAEHGASRPDRDARIRTLERGIAKTYGSREESARPLLLEDLERIANTLGAGARADRDRALLLLGFWGALRAGELAALRIEHIDVRADAVRVFLEQSKSDPERRGTTVHIARGNVSSLCALAAVRDWLGRLRQVSGPLLRTVMAERIFEHPMSSRAISRVVMRGARVVGLEHVEQYSAHSLRAGLATSAYLRGVSEREIQAHGRWRDRRSLDRYIQVCAARDRPNLVTAFA